MKINWAVLLGLSATVWSFEGDWSSWDENRDVEETKAEEILSYGTPGLGTGGISFYEFRAMGRSESRWMGFNTGGSPEIAGLNGGSYFDWSRLVGRSEAHLTDGFIRSGQTLATDQSTTQDRRAGCTVHEATRSEGRFESKDTDPDTEPTASPAGQDVSESC